jgi:hypothetical protein
MAIPIHRLESGALLLFTFFMISDPRTTPDSRAGRVLFGALVAAGAWYVQFRLFRTNGLLWSLAGVSVLVPLIDWLLPGSRYEWSRPSIGRISSSFSSRKDDSDGHLAPNHEDMFDGRPGWAARLVRPGAARLLRFLRSQG